MKRTLLLTVCVLASLTMSAQKSETDNADYLPFVELDKRWHMIRFKEYRMVEEVERDRKIYVNTYFLDNDWHTFRDLGLFREENRQVYKYDETLGRDIMLYDFSLKEGDTFTYEYGFEQPVNCKVLKQGWLEDGPQIVASCTLTTDNTYDIKYRKLRTWTIGRDNGSGEYQEVATWVECIGALENMFVPLEHDGYVYPNGGDRLKCYLAYIERTDHEVGYNQNEYLPFSFYYKEVHEHGCNLPKGPEDNLDDDMHHQLTYELEGNRLHVYGKAVLNCGSNNYAYFSEERTDDPLVRKLYFEIQEVGPSANCISLFDTDFYVSGFDPDLNYIVVDNNGEEHPVINKTQQMAYRPMIEDGKVWKVGTLISDNSVQIVDYYYFDGDTIISGKTCKQMMCQEYISPNYRDWKADDPLKYVGAWYEEDKKVYFYDTTNKQFVLMYDFSLDDNAPLQIHGQSYVVGPRKTGGIKGFKGVYREVWEYRDGGNTFRCTPWMEGVGVVYGFPTSNVFNVELADPASFLMSCTVGDEVIYLNDEYEDGATPAEARKRRIDFTHTIKIQPKARIKQEESEACINSSERDVARPKVKSRTRSGAEESMYGEYNDQQLCINLDPLDDAYQVRITDESGKAVYEKDINAGSIVGLNIDISTYAKGRYTVTLENSGESFTGEFGAGNADANGDGGVNVADVDYVIEHIGEAFDEKNKAADVNDDGEINVADVDYIIERIK